MHTSPPITIFLLHGEYQNFATCKKCLLLTSYLVLNPRRTFDHWKRKCQISFVLGLVVTEVDPLLDKEELRTSLVTSGCVWNLTRGKDKWHILISRSRLIQWNHFDHNIFVKLVIKNRNCLSFHLKLEYDIFLQRLPCGDSRLTPSGQNGELRD